MRLRSTSEQGRGLSWSVRVELTGSRVDAEGLARLGDVLRREFPELEAVCDLWSGRLAVAGVVAASTPTEALDSALAALNTAFAWAGLELKGIPEVAAASLRRRGSAPPAAGGETLQDTLLRRVSPLRRE